nr:MAG TPA: hypothetical protein [Caudoviricetes sp.]
MSVFGLKSSKMGYLCNTLIHFSLFFVKIYIPLYSHKSQIKQ